MSIILPIAEMNIQILITVEGTGVYFHPSRPGEHDHKVASVIALGAVDVTDPEFGVIGAEDICGVGSAVHPPVKRSLWILRDHVILTDP